MRYSLSFLPEVEEDAINVFLWYEEKAKGLGEEFLRVFYAGTAEIARNPLLYRKLYKDFRRCLLKRFPYSVYFLNKDETIIVYGIFHCARDPHLIKEKINTRNS